MVQSIRQLRDIGLPDAMTTGSKAARLGEALRAGFAVPDGFVVLPGSQDAHLAEARRSLGDVPLAVRSSSLDEDQAGRSRAGRYRTELDVRHDLAAAVARCRAAGPPGMPVLIQRMAACHAAGVLFTADPVRGDRSIMVVEAAPGPGERVVSGAVQPDLVRMRGRDGSIISIRRGTYAQEGRPESGGGTEGVAMTRGQQVAWERLARDLWTLGQRLERLFEEPLDVEWAADEEGRIALLQARPITTLPEATEPLWTRRFGDTYWSGAVSPLTFSLMAPWITEENLGGLGRLMGFRLPSGPPLRLHDSHVYLDTRFGEAVAAYCPPSLRERLLRPLVGPDSDLEAACYRPAAFLLGVLRAWWRDPDSGLSKNHAALERHGAQVGLWAASVRKELTGACPSAQVASEQRLLGLWMEMDGFGRRHFRITRWGLAGYHGALHALLEWLVRRWMAGPLAAWLVGPPRSSTALQNDELAALAGRASPADPVGIRAFVERHGHRSGGRDLSLPRWREVPGDILAAMGALSRRHREVGGTGEAVPCSSSWGNVRGWVLERVAAWTRRYAAYREDQRYILDHILEIARLIALEKGAHRGIDAPWLLTATELFPEARDLAAHPFWPGPVEERSARLAVHRTRTPPTYLRGHISFDEPVSDDAGDRIPGLGTSPGRVRGLVRVLHDPRDVDRLRPGEILVAPTADPAWAAAFHVAGGVVLESGGMLCHGAILAREAGVPAVTDVTGACSRLRDGELVEVDGSSGAVLLERRSPASC